MRLADPAKVFVCFLARGEAVGHGESLNNRQERTAEEGKENGKEKKGWREGRVPVFLQMAHAYTNMLCGCCKLVQQNKTRA